jgi:hypothetical protein
VHIGLFEGGLPKSGGRRIGLGPGHHERKGAGLVGPGLDWPGLGAQPCWLGMESFECAAALMPSYLDDYGVSERDRYLAGASLRGEIALLISMIGDEGPTPSGYGRPLSVSEPLLGDALVGGRRLPSGATVSLAEGLSPADRDLGLRLRNRPPDTWWALELKSRGSSKEAQVPVPATGPAGILAPILVNPLGAPVVAAWTPRGLNVRWYILPDHAEWSTVIDWLVRRALPVYVPDVLRRVRSAAYFDPDLQTEAEAKARQALADLGDRYAREKKRLEEELRIAEADAEVVRNGLLYGTGRELVEAVVRVITAAGFEVSDLDIELGGTKSADLLVTLAGRCRLVEVKSASGNASESLVGDLLRHLAAWPRMRPGQPVTNGVLIVNHQHRKPPRERTERVYDRPEAAPYPVLSARQLFDWYRTSDWDAIRNAILGHEHGATGNIPRSDLSHPTWRHRNPAQ